MAAQNDLSCYKGEAIAQPFTHVAPGTTSPGLDITNWTIEFSLRTTPTNPLALLQVQPLPIIDPTHGRYNLNLTSAQTKAIRAGVYFYDIQRIDGGSEAVLSIGRFEVLQEVLYP